MKDNGTAAKIIGTVGVALAAHCLFPATECVWKGGASGDIWDEKNWSPEHIPSSVNSSAYVAVFTNTVTLTSTEHWYPAGIVVSNSAKVVCKAARCSPAGACENGEFVVTVEDGASFIFDGTIFYGSSALTLVKNGGGEFNPKWWCGNANTFGAYWHSIDVQGGSFISPAKENFLCVGGSVRIRSGAKARITMSSPFGTNPATGFSYPKIEVDAGGIFDLNGRSAIVSSLSGEGDVINCSGTLTLNLRDSSEVFSGSIFGAGILAVKPDESETPADATWTVGSQNALAGVSLKRETVEGCSYEVLFKPGVGTFYMNSVPQDIPHYYDTDGNPVEIIRSWNFWYVDCGRDGGEVDGKSLGTAFKTLKEALTNPDLSSGDTVWVAPGDYSSGDMTSGGKTARVIVPKEVRLVSLGGAENTAIIGDSSPSGNYGVGDGAVRCVILGAGATLRGFTLRGGRTESGGYGGGVYAEPDSVIIGCVISNCAAARGGGVYRGRYFNCRFSTNRATGGNLIGAHIYEKAELYNCLLKGGLGACDWYANRSDSLALNCTFADNPYGSVRGLGTEAAEHVKVYNSLVLSGISNGSQDEFFRSVISYGGSTGEKFSECTLTGLTASTEPSVYHYLKLDRDTMRPKLASSNLVGAADLSRYRSLFPVEQYFLSVFDVYGVRRIRGDELDIGAAAYDPDSKRNMLKIIIR